jgi:hypothetical protein
MIAAPSDSIDRTQLYSGLWAVGVEPPGDLAFLPECLAHSGWKRRLIFRSILHKMLPMAAGFFRDRGWDPGEQLPALEEAFRATNRILYRSIEPVAEALNGAGVPVLLLKGGDLHLRAYRWRTGLARVMSDLDLLVRPQDVPTTVQALEGCGFRQGWMDRATLSFRPVARRCCRPIDLAPLPAGEPQPDHYELQVFGRFVRSPELAGCTRDTNRFLKVKDYHVTMAGGEAWVPVKCDVHVNVSRGIDPADVWHGTSSIRMPGGAPVLVQSPANALWFLASRLYHEVRETGGVLRQFIDVLALIHAARGEIDWDRVAAMGRKYGMLPPLCHVLGRAREALGGMVPSSVIRDCSPSRGTLSDRGDFMPRLFAARGRKVRTVTVALDC